MAVRHTLLFFAKGHIYFSLKVTSEGGLYGSNQAYACTECGRSPLRHLPIRSKHGPGSRYCLCNCRRGTFCRWLVVWLGCAGTDCLFTDRDPDRADRTASPLGWGALHVRSKRAESVFWFSSRLG